MNRSRLYSPFACFLSILQCFDFNFVVCIRFRIYLFSCLQWKLFFKRQKLSHIVIVFQYIACSAKSFAQQKKISSSTTNGNSEEMDFFCFNWLSGWNSNFCIYDLLLSTYMIHLDRQCLLIKNPHLLWSFTTFLVGGCGEGGYCAYIHIV